VLLPAEEAAVAAAGAKRRTEFAAVRACARRALTNAGLPAGPIPRSQSGAPIWPSGVVGSMTHCKGYRACAIGRAEAFGAIGIDAEPHEPLPGGVLLMVANAAHIKNVPGRKTDINDATWIADLVSCGLIKASFVPEQEIQELRSLLRARKQVTREQSSQIQRIQKTLEEANIKLDTVISDILGVSGRRMIEAMIEGVRNPFKLVELADRRIKASPKVLYDALHGRLTDHHRFMLRLYLRQYDALAGAIAEIDQEIDAAIARMDAGPLRLPTTNLFVLATVTAAVLRVRMVDR